VNAIVGKLCARQLPVALPVPRHLRGVQRAGLPDDGHHLVQGHSAGFDGFADQVALLLCRAAWP
jgi:hypothetical protein